MQSAWDQQDDGEILTEWDLPRLQRRGQERIERIGWSVPPDSDMVAADLTAEDLQASRRGPAIRGVGAGGYNFQVGWGGNSHSTSS